MNVLWAIPNKPENISIGRERIADGLGSRGHEVRTEDSNRVLLQECITGNYDAVLSSCAIGAALGPIANARGVGYVVDYVDPIMQMYHSSTKPLPQAAYVAQAIAFRCADAIIYTYDEETLRVSRFDKPIAKTTLGVEYDRFADPECRGEFDLPERFAVYIGGLEEIYNIKPMLESAVGTYNLVIAGTGSQEEIVAEYANDTPEITYLGEVQHKSIPHLLSLADVGINLADDPHTCKVLEYAAAGLPIVHAEGRAEQTLPNEVTFTAVDAESIATAVTSTMGDNVGRGLREYAKERNYSTVVDDYEEVLCTLQ